MTRKASVQAIVALLSSAVFASVGTAMGTTDIGDVLFELDPGLAYSFGYSVDICDTLVIVGAMSGSAYVFNLNTEALLQTFGPDEYARSTWGFGVSVAIDGNLAVVGSPAEGEYTDDGAVYVFDVTSGARLHKFSSAPGSDASFGYSVDISGSTVAAGAPTNSGNAQSSGKAYIIDLAGGPLTAELECTLPSIMQGFGTSVSISGTTVVVGAPYEFGPNLEDSVGAAYVFDVATATQLHRLSALDAHEGGHFGCGLDISGNMLLVGAHGFVEHGSAYIFDLTTGTQLRKLTHSNPSDRDYFGFSVAIDGDRAMVGAYDRDDSGFGGPGAAYLFDGATGEELHYFPGASYSGCDFGRAVDLSGNVAVVGDSGPYGNGCEAAYVLDITPPTGVPPETAKDASRLFRECPNPYILHSALQYVLPSHSQVTIRIYDLRGRLVKTLVDGEFLPAGQHRAIWDGTSEAGSSAVSGVYFARITAGELSDTRKLTLAK